MSENEVITPGDVEGQPLSPKSFEGPDLENLWEGQVNDQEVKQMESELLLPVGTYTTVPGNFKRRDYPADAEHDNRRSASFFGRIVKTDETGKETVGALGYSLSPDRRNKFIETESGAKEDTGKPDFKSSLYVQAVKAYTVAYGEAPQKEINVLNYLVEFPHRVRVIKTKDNRNLIVSISAVVES